MRWRAILIALIAAAACNDGGLPPLTTPPSPSLDLAGPTSTTRTALDLAFPACPTAAQLPEVLSGPCTLAPGQECDYPADFADPPFYCECGSPNAWFCEPLSHDPPDLGF